MAIAVSLSSRYKLCTRSPVRRPHAKILKVERLDEKFVDPGIRGHDNFLGTGALTSSTLAKAAACANSVNLQPNFQLLSE